MPEITVPFDRILQRQLSIEYMYFERNRQLKKRNWFLITGFFFAVATAGLVFEQPVISAIGLIAFATTFVWIGYYLLRVNAAIAKWKASFDKMEIAFGTRITVQFNENELTTELLGSFNYLEWSPLTKCIDRGEVVYLFRKPGELFEIISSEMVGTEFFKQLKVLLAQKHLFYKSDR